MFFRLSFVTLIFAAVALGTPIKRDAAEVASAIQNLAGPLQALDAAINALPSSGGTAIEIYNIQREATNVKTAIETATNDVTGSADFTDAESDTNNGLLAGLVPLVEKALNDLVVKKSAITALNAAPNAKDDLEALKIDTNAFGSAILVKTPADKQSYGQEQLNAMNTKISAAIDTYST